jgi:large subunit ribosomal protein L3
MAHAILGKKIGMTQVYSEDNRVINVTVIEAGPCAVLSVKEKSVQVGFDPVKEKHLTKPEIGYFKKLKLEPRRLIREVIKDPAKEYKVGEELKVDMFLAGDYVDVSGISKGKGFQGGMKRWHWKGGMATHGSTSHRRVGSMGSTTTPGRVWKGHHLPGHMGNVRVTLQNLEVVKADLENNLLLVKGAVPGHKNSYLMIRKAKKKGHKNALTVKAAAAQATKKGGGSVPKAPSASKPAGKK